MQTHAPMLRMTGIDKTFGSVRALRDLDFEVASGEIHALLGVNGAGKSTLIKILSGIQVADAGTIEIAGAPVTIASPRDAIDAGVASVQQHPELVGDFAGYENIFLGQETERPGLFRRIDHKAMRGRAEALLGRLPVGIDLGAPVRDMPGVEREIVAILHSLKRDNIRILILDEPTSTLTRVERDRLFVAMRRLKAAGVSIIYITHHLEEVFEIADRFTVFRAGQKVTTMTPAEATAAGILIPTLMLSEEMGELFPPKRGTEVTGVPALKVRGLSGEGFRDVSLSVHKGEIVGIYGLVGSGIDALGKALFGALRPEAGEIVLNSKPVAFATPKQALDAGVFLVPGDRRTEGLVLSENVIFNTTLARLGRAANALGFLRFGRSRAVTAELARQVALQPPILDRPTGAFSGGNQQKIVIAKGLYQQAALYVFVEPTVGVDIGARATLYELIRRLSDEAAVIVMSSDCDEVFGVADRVAALYRGALVAPPSAATTRDQLMNMGFTGQAA